MTPSSSHGASKKKIKLLLREGHVKIFWDHFHLNTVQKKSVKFTFFACLYFFDILNSIFYLFFLNCEFNLYICSGQSKIEYSFFYFSCINTKRIDPLTSNFQLEKNLRSLRRESWHASRHKSWYYVINHLMYHIVSYSYISHERIMPMKFSSLTALDSDFFSFYFF